MPLQLVWRPGLAAGRAILKIEPAVPGPVTLQIGNLPRPGEATVFLHPHLEDSQVWQPQPWAIALPPDLPVTVTEQGLELEVGRELLWHLKPGKQYQCVATVADSEPVEGRLTFPKGLVLTGERPERWTISAPTLATQRTESPANPEPVVPPATPAPTPEPVRPPAAVAAPAAVPAAGPAPMAAPTPAPAPAPSTSGRGKLVAGAVAACVLLAGAAYVLSGQPPADPPATAAAAPATVPDPAPAPTDEMTLAGVRSFLAGNPAPEEARQQAEGLAAAGQLLDGQFLLHRYAAEKGDAVSARALGQFYDPATWATDKSPLPAPNPVEAARWYQKSAEAGDVESQYRYGMLLRSGRTDDPDGPERSVAWLTKAADQGHAAAKQALGL